MRGGRGKKSDSCYQLTYPGNTATQQSVVFLPECRYTGTHQLKPGQLDSFIYNNLEAVWAVFRIGFGYILRIRIQLSNKHLKNL